MNLKVPHATRKYTPEEKQQLIQNLDIEVEHRVRQLEEWLAVALDNFRLHQEALVSRIPKLVREVTMGEFADKYDGDVQACLRGLQSARVGGTEFEIDKDTRKRKWAAAQEEVEASGSGQTQEGDRARAPKNARMMTATPKKAAAASNARTIAANRTPGTLRTTTTTTTTKTTRPPVPKPASSPNKPLKPPLGVRTRATSPPKQNAAAHPRTRPPSSATFNPTMLPPKAPTYPTLRAPRRDESMLSVNGSPLANPYALGLGWFAGEDDEDGGAAVGEEEEVHLQAKGKKKQPTGQLSRAPRRVNSIVIRRDPSVTIPSSSSSSSSQPQPPPPPPSRTTNGTSSRSRTRTESHAQALSSSSSSSNDNAHAHASAAAPLVRHASSSASALVSIPTRDGHLLEFDPLTTSPRALDKLVGITDSAKKQARAEMARLVKEAVRKWVID